LQVEAAARMSKELADMQVVLLCAAELVGKVLAEAGVEDSHFDVLTAAFGKSTEDIDRGVRRAHWGDPCRFCGTPYDEVEVGDCPGCAGEEVAEV
jgi:hypothetical protein